MKDSIATIQSRSNGVRLREITDGCFPADALEIGKIAALANKQAKFSTLSGKLASHMMAYKAGRTCYKHFHELALLFLWESAAMRAEGWLYGTFNLMNTLNRIKCNARAALGDLKLENSSRIQSRSPLQLFRERNTSAFLNNTSGHT